LRQIADGFRSAFGSPILEIGSKVGDETDGGGEEKISDSEVAGEDVEHLFGVFGARVRIV
jgi:hypothetical protein